MDERAAPQGPLSANGERPPAGMTAERRGPQILPSAWLRALPAASRWILRGGAPVLAAAAAVLGLPASSAACRAQAAGRRAVLWLGPDERLILGPEEEAESMHAALDRALRGQPHSLVDVSHRQAALEVSGPYAANALNLGCPLDLHASAFPVGMCTRTVLNKGEIVLWRTGADRFHLEVARSYVPYVCGLLAEAAEESRAYPSSSLLGNSVDARPLD
jgi:sarcosine oxidase, subunit gamma